MEPMGRGAVRCERANIYRHGLVHFKMHEISPWRSSHNKVIRPSDSAGGGAASSRKLLLYTHYTV